MSFTPTVTMRIAMPKLPTMPYTQSSAKKSGFVMK